MKDNAAHAGGPGPSAAAYFCPMCEGVESDRPGDCPMCGMALERNVVGAGGGGGDDSELRDMTRRLWIGGVLALPVVALAMAHLVPPLAHLGSGVAGLWAQFLLATPVVWWAGWPFLVRGARSIRNGRWNMFTLVGLGVGVAWSYSVAAFLFSDAFPPAMRVHGGRAEVYFEAAAVIVVLVLLGQVLELRARARTSSAIRALLDLAPPAAALVTDVGEFEVELSEVRAGDLLRVRPGAEFPWTASSRAARRPSTSR